MLEMVGDRIMRNSVKPLQLRHIVDKEAIVIQIHYHNNSTLFLLSRPRPPRALFLPEETEGEYPVFPTGH